jgi:hypothetical protein
VNYLPELALNHNPPDLCLLRSWNPSHEPPAPGSILTFWLLVLAGTEGGALNSPIAAVSLSSLL